MAITRDDFQNIPSSGVIPDDMVPATEFAVSFAFTYTGTPALTTFNHTFTGTIRIQFTDAAGAVKYLVEIEETYNLFIFPLAPGLVLYSWNWVPSAEKIEGRKGAEPDAPLMETLGLGTFGVDPAEGSGTSDREVIVDSRFYSVIWVEPLDTGDKLKIVFHNLSAGFVVSRASLQLATEVGAGVLRSLFDGDHGQTFLLLSRSGALRLARTRRMQISVDIRVRVDPDTELPEADQDQSRVCDYETTVWEGTPQFAMLHRCGSQLFVPVARDGFRMYGSRDEGVTWSPVTQIESGDDTMRTLATAMTADGESLFRYGTATAETPAEESDDVIAVGDVVFQELKHGTAGGWLPAEYGKVKANGGAELPTTNIAGLEWAGGVMRLTYKTGTGDAEALAVLISTDGLRSLGQLALS